MSSKNANSFVISMKCFALFGAAVALNLDDLSARFISYYKISNYAWLI